MRTASSILSISVAASLLGLLAAGAVGCSSTSSEPAPGASSGATTGTSGGTPTPAPKVPPKGAPADAPPVDPTNDPSLAACTGTPGQLDALVPKKLTLGDDVPLCKFDGNVLLIVNVASHCGNTPQYAPLEALYQKYRAQGFYILGFPSPQFGAQEFTNEADVTAFCTSTYNITFPMFAIGDVNGPNKQPVYDWIHAQPGGPAPDGYARDVQWNFEKYLVNRHGTIVQRIENGTYPDDPAVVAAIEAELAKK
jgi:glutathione peroxidase